MAFDLQSAFGNLERHRRENLHDEFWTDGRMPYDFQMEFYSKGVDYRYRHLAATNRGGKTFGLTYEVSSHGIAKYPDWWPGKVYKRPVTIIVSGDTKELIRDTTQRYLLGSPEEIGTGWIPKRRIKHIAPKSGVQGAVDYVVIESAFGGYTYLYFKSYEQDERKTLRGMTVDIHYYDEGCPLSFYSEAATRTAATRPGEKGMVLGSFTDFDGTDLSNYIFDRWEQQKKTGEKSLWVQFAHIDQAKHMSEEERKELIAMWPPHERESRMTGMPPLLGSGLVYPVNEDKIVIPQRELPEYYHHIAGIDFGYGEGTAVVWRAIDPVTKRRFVYDEFYLTSKDDPDTGNFIYRVAQAIRARGTWIPVVWPEDGRKIFNGRRLVEIYRQEHGINMMNDPVKFDDGSKSVNDGLLENLMAMREGNLKVMDNCQGWLSERRKYRYDRKKPDTIAPKQKDHIMDADRYAMMGERFAIPAPHADEGFDDDGDLVYSHRTRRQRRDSLDYDPC